MLSSNQFVSIVGDVSRELSMPLEVDLHNPARPTLIVYPGTDVPHIEFDRENIPEKLWDLRVGLLVLLRRYRSIYGFQSFSARY